MTAPDAAKPAEKKSIALEPPKVSLPKGGGAVRGIGESFTANPVTGSAGLSVPVTLSAARPGGSPQFALSYDSGAGNGPFGLGWSIGTPMISRRTDRGVPRYRDGGDPATADVFLLSGTEDLVPVLEPDGAGGRRPYHRDIDGYRIERFRPRIEGPFARIERWTRLSGGDVHWRSITRENVTTRYGIGSSSRIADPADPSRVAVWLVAETYDDRGNAVHYTYRGEDSAGIDPAWPAERNRTELARGANRYLKRIGYGNRAPYQPGEDLAKRGDWMFELIFDYGEHCDEEPPDDQGREFIVATRHERRAWPVRADSFSSYRYGFEVRTYRLCQRLLLFHDFPDESTGAHCLVRSTDLRHAADPVATTLSAVTHAGYLRAAGNHRYRRRSLPALEMRYSVAGAADVVHTVTAEELGGVAAPPDGTRARWADLDGDGMVGLLAEESGAWWYAANRAAGPAAATQFDPVAAVGSRPSLATLGSGRQSLTDLAGDGTPDLVELMPPLSGFHEREPGRGWAPLQPFDGMPVVDWAEPNLRLVDLTGDGHADALVTDEDGLTWHPSLGEQGFGPARRVAIAPDEDVGPAVVLGDRDGAVQLADMTGDGLTDLVRVGNGEICYWPNLGHGRFGPRVVMAAAPVLDRPDLFDPKRIRLVDVDGSGPADLIYLGSAGLRLHRNHAGNGWGPVQLLEAVPPADPWLQVDVLDLLGTGTACLTWWPAGPGPAAAIHYVQLTGGIKPYLLTGVDNNMGSETRYAYTPSTWFYQADRLAGRPWASRLPFPVHTLSRVETFDHVGRNRFVSRYAYHHGYFDGPEREFRGFGLVEQIDTEELGALAGGAPAENLGAGSHVPPVLTRSWFHTGAYLPGGPISAHYTTEYFREPGATGADPALLPDTTLPAELSAAEQREACRALRGRLLRQEVYALDGSDRETIPYGVTEQSFNLRLLQPMDGTSHPVFLVHPEETLSIHYERDPDDPRVAHHAVLDVDDFGDVLASVSVGYGRRVDDQDPALSTADKAAQRTPLLTLTRSAFTAPVDTATAWRPPSPWDTRTWELTGVTPAAGAPKLSLSELRGAVAIGTEIPYEDPPTGQGPQLRLIEAVKTSYRRDDLAGPLPDGVAGSFGLTYESYQLALTPGLRESLYGGLVGDAELATRCGYVQLPGESGWWLPSGRTRLSPGAADPPATELAHARLHFFVERRVIDPYGQSTTVQFDPYDLHPVRTVDAVGNVTGAEIDYRVLEPWQVTDPNGNRTSVLFDGLGLIVASAQQGRPGQQLGDSLAGLDPDPPQQVVDGFLADPTGPLAADLLGDAGSRTVYDVGLFARTRATSNPQPVVAATLTRAIHASEQSGTASPVEISLSYGDGFARQIQAKSLAEPGPLTGDSGPAVDPRWAGTGWTVLNNKGQPVRNYEPFFTATHRFEFATTVGVSPIALYDPAGRVVAVVRADHAWSKVVIGPWRQVAWDVTDTVLTDPAADPDVGPLVALLPAADYLPTWYDQRSAGGLGPDEQAASGRAGTLAGTPVTSHLDALGRVFRVVADAGGGTVSASRIRFDIEGNAVAVHDALDRVVRTSVFDLAGREVAHTTMDGGTRLTLFDASGGPSFSWDARGDRVRHGYDPARRIIEVWLLAAGQTDERLIERTEYGEAQGSAANHRAKVYRVFDHAGVVTHEAYDFTGNLTHSTRTLAVDFRTVPDWSSPVALELESFSTRTRFDALRRPRSMTAPDGSVVRPSYNVAGFLERIEMQLAGDGAPTVLMTGAVYNAKGKRVEVSYGNGAVTALTYDPLTGRLRRLVTTRGSQALQDHRYTYDPTGNIVRIGDQAAQTTFFSNTVIEATADYWYDALSRLIEATGREHVGQTGAPASWDDAPRVGLAHPQDGQAMRRYREHYDYDKAGNLLAMTHLAPGNNWTRTFNYDQPSRINPAEVGDRAGSSTVGGTTETFGYDPHGCLTGLPHLGPPNLPSMTWDVHDQLRRVDRGGGGVVWYCCDANGERVRKVVDRLSGTRAEQRLYLGAFEIYRKYDGSGGTAVFERTTLTVSGDLGPIALAERRTTGDDGSPARLLRYQLANHQASVRLELGEGGSLLSYEEFYPYGCTSYQAVRSQTDAPKRLRYSGKEREEETGLIHHDARPYAPWLARWCAPDPAGVSDELNRYAYVQANPVLFMDDTGREASVDQLMTEMVKLRHRNPKTFVAFLQKNEKFLYPLLHAYGYNGCFVKDEAYLADFDAAARRWNPAGAAGVVSREPDPNEVVLGALPDGTGYVGRRSSWKAAVRAQQAQRTLRTLDNIRGGPMGAAGYLIGGDKGSDVGGALDGLMVAAGATAGHRANNQALSNAPASRPTTVSASPGADKPPPPPVIPPPARRGGAGGNGVPPGGPGGEVFGAGGGGRSGNGPSRGGGSGGGGLRVNGLTVKEAKLILDHRTKTFNLPPSPTEAKTTIVGILVLESGEQIPLRSGEHGGPWGGTQRGGFPRGRGSGFTRHSLTHVEGHAAAVMHQRGIKKATLLIEKAPCGGCDLSTGRPNISAMLPKGAMLTVVDPTSAGTYRSTAP